jgi:superfamily I DNA and/or RNA helicase
LTDKAIEAKIRKYGYSPFETKKEEPNYYELEDGTILKIYPVLIGIIMDQEKQPEGASVNAQNVVAAFVPLRLKGTPSEQKYTLQEVNANLDKEDMKFKVLNEHFNEYVIDNKWLLSVKTTLTQVNRSKLRNNKGEPLYHVATSPVIKLKPKRR